MVLVNPYELPFALFAFLGVAVVAPAWVYFVDTYLLGPPEVQFFATALLPFLGLLLLVSWVQPG